MYKISTMYKYICTNIYTYTSISNIILTHISYL